MPDPYLSLVVPCYNEEPNLKRGVLEEMRGYLARLRIPWEVLVVDDGSTDGGAEIVREFAAANAGFSLLRIPHGGKPAAVWAGIKGARGEIVLVTDMDQSTPVSEWDRLAPWHERGYDAVIGSRGACREGYPLLRRLSARVFRSLRRFFVLREISDTQCGFKSLRRRAALAVFPHLRFLRRKRHPSGWKVTAFDVELIFLLLKAGYSVKEVEVSWRHRDESRGKHGGGSWAGYIRESVEMAREVIGIRLRQISGGYSRVRPGMEEESRQVQDCGG